MRQVAADGVYTNIVAATMPPPPFDATR